MMQNALMIEILCTLPTQLRFNLVLPKIVGVDLMNEMMVNLSLKEQCRCLTHFL